MLSKKKLSRNLNAFCEQTTIHGFSYVSDVSNQVVIKVGWGLLISVFLTLASFLIKLSFDDWSENPTLTTIDSDVAPIEELPFPAVTVCQEDRGLRPAEKWSLVTDILNSASWDCHHEEYDYYGNACKPGFTLTGRPDIQKALRKIFDGLVGISKNKLFHLKYPSNQIQSWQDIASQTKPPIPMTAFVQPYVNYATGNDNVSFDKILNELYKQVVESHLAIDLEEHFSSYYGNLSRSSTNPEVDLNVCFDDPECRPYLEEGTNIALLITFVEKLKVDAGTLLAYSAQLLGEYFLGGFSEVDITDEEQTLDNLFTGWMASMTNGSAKNISILDVTSLFSPADIRYNQIMAPSPWTQQVRGIFKGYETTNCSSEEFFYVYFVNIYLAFNFPQWHSLEQDVFPHPCYQLIQQAFGNHLKEIMLIMSYSINNNGVRHLLMGSSVQSWENKVNRLVKPMDVQFEVDDRNRVFNDIWTNILQACSFAVGEYGTLQMHRGSAHCLEHLKPQLSSGGICYAFNAEPQMEIFKKSRYLEDFQELFEPSDSKPIHPDGFGPTFGFFMILNNQLYLQPRSEVNMKPEDLNKRSSSFLISIRENAGAYELFRQAITVKPGYRTRIKVIQSQVVATSDLKSLSIESRKCRFPDENENMKLFVNYSINACQFECAMRNAAKKCQCIPWNFPRTDEEYKTMAICDMFLTHYFLQEMKNVSNYMSKECGCIRDCQGTSYTLFETTEELKPLDLCRELRVHEITLRASRNKLSRMLFLMLYNETMPEDIEFCSKIVREQLSFVSVELASNTFMKSITSQRINFLGQLSSLGGTLGLFTGMSLLSFVEILFWCGKSFFSLIYPNRIYRVAWHEQK